jgi:hypothetical protein
MLSRRRAARTLLLTMTVAGFVGVPAAPAVACSCASFTDTQARSHAHAVFLGDVVQRRVTHRTGTAVYVVKVSRVYKGKARATQEVVTPSNGGACGLELPETGRALFFAYASGMGALRVDPAPGQLASHLCSGTRTADQAPAAFGAGMPPERSGAGGPATATDPTSTGPGARPEAPAEPAGNGVGLPALLTLLALGSVLVVAGVLGIRRTRVRPISTA